LDNSRIFAKPLIKQKFENGTKGRFLRPLVLLSRAESQIRIGSPMRLIIKLQELGSCHQRNANQNQAKHKYKGATNDLHKRWLQTVFYFNVFLELTRPVSEKFQFLWQFQEHFQIF
jgi:hypothetical protein